MFHYVLVKVGKYILVHCGCDNGNQWLVDYSYGLNAQRFNEHIRCRKQVKGVIILLSEVNNFFKLTVGIAAVKVSV